MTMHAVGWGVVAVIVMGCAPLRGQLDPENLRRYEARLWAHPGPGAAFDRVFQHYRDQGQIESWVARLTSSDVRDGTDFARHLLLALIHERQGSVDLALTSFFCAVSASPERADVRLFRARLLMRVRRFEDALTELQAVLEGKAQNPIVLECMKLSGRALLALGRMEEARARWAELVERFPGATSVRQELVDLLVDEGQLADAVIHLEALRRRLEDPYARVKATLDLADLRIRSEDMDAARALFRELLEETAPNSWVRRDVFRRIEGAFAKRFDQRGLLEFYDAWGRAHDEDVEVLLMTAALRRRMGDEAKATRIYEGLLARDGRLSSVRRALADHLRDTRQFEDAALQYELLAAESADGLELWPLAGEAWLRAWTLQEADRRDRARKAFEHLTEGRSEDPVRHLLLAETVRRHGFVDEAQQAYTRAAVLDPNNPTPLLEAGRHLSELGRGSDACARWRELLTGPLTSRRETWRTVALAMVGAGFPDDALAVLREGASIVPKDGLFALNALRVSILVDLERHREAKALLPELGGLAQSRVELRELLELKLRVVAGAQVGSRIDRVEIRSVARTLEATHDLSVWDHLFLVRLHEMVNDRTAAAATVKTALNAFPRDPDLLEAAEEIFRSVESFEAARRCLEILVEVSPERRTRWLAGLASIYRLERNFPAAIAMMEQVLEENPGSVDSWAFLARLQRALGDQRAVVQVLRRATSALPRAGELRMELARELFDAGELAEGRAEYWRVLDSASKPSLSVAAAERLAQSLPTLAADEMEILVQRLFALEFGRESLETVKHATDAFRRICQGLRRHHGDLAARLTLRLLEIEPDDARRRGTALSFIDDRIAHGDAASLLQSVAALLPWESTLRGRVSDAELGELAVALFEPVDSTSSGPFGEASTLVSSRAVALVERSTQAGASDRLRALLRSGEASADWWERIGRPWVLVEALENPTGDGRKTLQELETFLTSRVGVALAEGMDSAVRCLLMRCRLDVDLPAVVLEFARRELALPESGGPAYGVTVHLVGLLSVAAARGTRRDQVLLNAAPLAKLMGGGDPSEGVARRTVRELSLKTPCWNVLRRRGLGREFLPQYLAHVHAADVLLDSDLPGWREDHAAWHGACRALAWERQSDPLTSRESELRVGLFIAQSMERWSDVAVLARELLALSSPRLASRIFDKSFEESRDAARRSLLEVLGSSWTREGWRRERRVFSLEVEALLRAHFLEPGGLEFLARYVQESSALPNARRRMGAALAVADALAEQVFLQGQDPRTNTLATLYETIRSVERIARTGLAGRSWRVETHADWACLRFLERAGHPGAVFADLSERLAKLEGLDLAAVTLGELFEPAWRDAPETSFGGQLVRCATGAARGELEAIARSFDSASAEGRRVALRLRLLSAICCGTDAEVQPLSEAFLREFREGDPTAPLLFAWALRRPGCGDLAVKVRPRR